MNNKIDSKIGAIIGIGIFAGLASAFGYWQYQQVSGLEQEKSTLWSKIGELNSQVDAWKATYEQNKNVVSQLNDERDSLISENSNLQSELDTLKNNYRTLQTANKQVEQELSISVQPPYTLIQGREIVWAFKDSVGNMYSWNMPIDTYRQTITFQKPLDIKNLKLSDGRIVSVRDHTKFVESKSFANVIDELYRNSGSDYQFLYEVWYVVSKMTTYSYDIGEDPKWALETFSEGGGDCEDTTILIASMLQSSTHTRDWEIQMVYFDSDNPENPTDVNHVALFVKTDDFATFVESTEKSDGLRAWLSTINGWYYDL